MPTSPVQADIDDEMVLNAIVEYYGDFNEIWIGPAIRHVSEVLKDEVLFVKRSIRRLSNMEAITVALRSGEPHDYHVIELNEEHPLVVKARGGLL